MQLPENFIANRYWNANGFAACAVAVRGGRGTDWAAYISGFTGESERDAILFTINRGTKLSESDAKALFSNYGFSDRLEYRP
jgi:hypothetical protein